MKLKMPKQKKKGYIKEKHHLSSILSWSMKFIKSHIVSKALSISSHSQLSALYQFVSVGWQTDVEYL